MPTPVPIVLCAGQYGSASTWMYNAIHALMAAAVGEDGVHRQFANLAEDLPARPDHRLLLLKTHEPGTGLRWLAARTGGKAVITVRDPRDAAASLIARFGFGYPLVSSRLDRCSAALPPLRRDLPCLVLRYEDGFSSDPRTLARVARFLGLPAGRRVVQAVFDSLTPDAVRAEIARLRDTGGFGPNPDFHSHDPASHWHPGHVGDGAPGKFRRVLTRGQVGDIVRRTRAFQDAFDYPMPPPAALRPGVPMSLEGWGPGLAYLGAGFAPPDPDGAWTMAEEARLDLPRRRRAATLTLDLDLPRPPRRRGVKAPANPMRWSLWAEGGPGGLTAPLLGPVPARATPARQAVTVALPAGATALVLRFEGLAPAQETGLERSRRLLGLRLRGFGLA